jgi:hypothetical protein
LVLAKAEAKRPDANTVADWRIWTDSSGKHKIEARLSSVASGQVQLIKHDGSLIQVPLDKLSDEDQQWVQRQAAPGAVPDKKTSGGEGVEPQGSSEGGRFRQWKDKTGRLSVDAELKGVERDVVQLAKRNGEKLSLSYDRLSDEDSDYLTKDFWSRVCVTWNSAVDKKENASRLDEALHGRFVRLKFKVSQFVSGSTVLNNTPLDFPVGGPFTLVSRVKVRASAGGKKISAGDTLVAEGDAKFQYGPCPLCKGTGKVPCPSCHGRGSFRHVEKSIVQQNPTGIPTTREDVSRVPCVRCRGSGFVPCSHHDSFQDQWVPSSTAQIPRSAPNHAVLYLTAPQISNTAPQAFNSTPQVFNTAFTSFNGVPQGFKVDPGRCYLVLDKLKVSFSRQGSTEE